MKFYYFMLITIFSYSCSIFNSNEKKSESYSDFREIAKDISYEFKGKLKGNISVVPLITRETDDPNQRGRFSKLGKVISEEIQYQISKFDDVKIVERSLDLIELINEYDFVISSGFTKDDNEKMNWEGAEYVILGTIEDVLGDYQVRVKVIEIKDARIIPSSLFILKKDKDGKMEKLFTEKSFYSTYQETLKETTNSEEKNNNKIDKKELVESKEKAFTKLDSETTENIDKQEMDKEKLLELMGLKENTNIELNEDKKIIFDKENSEEISYQNVFPEILKEKNRLFQGKYIIKPLWAEYTFVDEGESGLGELYIIIKVGEKTFKTSFKQDKDFVNFDGEFFETEISKDELITIELWDADAFEDDLLGEQKGLTPLDLDDNSIFYLKNEKGSLGLLFLKIDDLNQNNNFFTKKIKYSGVKDNDSDSTFDISCQFEYSYPIYIGDDKEFMKLFFKEIDSIFYFVTPFSKKYQEMSDYTSYSVQFNENNILSILFSSGSYYCGGNGGGVTPISLNFDLKNRKMIKIEDLLFENSYNSKSISKLLVEKFKNSDDWKSGEVNESFEEIENVKYSTFVIKKSSLIFPIRTIRPKINVYSSLTFEELNGIIKDSWIKEISKNDDFIGSFHAE
ncbi:hypothetical protein JXR93_11825 [bacterium]|nr:hypothetical protein [bacterium]